MIGSLESLIKKPRFTFRRMLISISIVFCTIILSISSYAFFMSIQDFIVSKFSDDYFNYIYLVEKEFTDTFSKLEKIASTISKNKLLLDNINNYERDISDKIHTQKEISSSLTKFKNYNDNILMIYFLTENNNFFISTEPTSCTFKDLKQYGFAGLLKDKMKFLEAGSEDYRLLRNLLKINVDSIVCQYPIFNNDIEEGQIIFVLRKDIFSRTLQKYLNIALVDNKNNVIFNNTNISNMDILKNEDFRSANNKYMYKDKNENIPYLSQISITGNQYKIFYFHQNTNIKIAVKNLKKYFFASLMTLIIVTVITSYFLAKIIVIPINNLSEAVDEYTLKEKANSIPDSIPPKLTLREHIMYYFMIIALMPLFMFFASSFYYIKNQLSEYLIELNQSSFNNISSNLDTYFDNKKRILNYIAYDSNIQGALSGGINQSYNEKLVKVIDNYQLLDIGHDDIYIYSLNLSPIISNTYDHKYPDIDISHINNSKRSNIFSFWLEPETDEYGRTYLAYIMTINDINTYNVSGYLLCKTYETQIEKVYTVPSVNTQNTYIIDNGGKVISTFNKKLLGSNYQKSISKIFTYDPLEKEIFKKNISDTEWSLIGFYDYKRIDESIMQIVYKQLYIVAILALFAVILSYIISIRFTSVIEKFNTLLRKMGISNIDIVFPEDTSINEIYRLAASFNNMVLRIETLVDQLILSSTKQIQLEARKKNAEMLALQSQINPHFIYNTFESIQWLIKSKSNEKAILMLDSFSNMLRYSTASKSMMITIEEEISHLNNYINIMDVRYNGRIKFICEIVSSILQYKTIKLILQPIVENAIYHGIRAEQEDGIIKISCLEEENELIFTISDNGKGIDLIALEEINKCLSSNAYPDRIGIFNVQTRIKLFFGDDYGITIDSKYGKGTIVKVRIPKSI
ncbi:MAG TPA: histidine kinase [Clostridiales bacterium]|nr:histidine kinase [Clostridiales bacterium]